MERDKQGEPNFDPNKEAEWQKWVQRKFPAKAGKILSNVSYPSGKHWVAIFYVFLLVIVVVSWHEHEASGNLNIVPIPKGGYNFNQLSAAAHLKSAQSLLAGSAQRVSVEAARLHLSAIPSNAPEFIQATSLLKETKALLAQFDQTSDQERERGKQANAAGVAILEAESARREAEKQRQETEGPNPATVSAYLFMSGFIDPRLDPNGGDLDVYVKKTEFESIPFPDRKKFFEDAGKLWCEQPQKDSFPALMIKDIRTGERFGKYSCTFGASIP